MDKQHKNDVLVSINQTKHIALHNYNNEFCYHISCLQRLQSSPTLNKVLKRVHNINDKYVNDTLYPSIVYANLTYNNVYDVYGKLKQWYTSYVNEYVGRGGLHGYMPLVLLTTILLPCVHAVCTKDEFIKVLEELNVERGDFNDISYVIHDIFTSSAYLQPQHQQHAEELYMNMLEDLPDEISRSNFCCTTLEVYPERNNQTVGHAVTLIQASDGTYKVIDDNVLIVDFVDYYIKHHERLYKIDIRDISSETFCELNELLRAHCNMSSMSLLEGRVHRYELCFEKHFNDYHQYIAQHIRGGNTKCNVSSVKERCKDILLLVLVFLVILITIKAVIEHNQVVMLKGRVLTQK